MKRTRSRGAWGFTLVELLVCLAVVAVLASLISAAVGRGMVAAQRTQCASNLRQIGMGLLTYAGEHQGALPPTTHSAGADFTASWIFVLGPYLEDVDRVRICPADPHGAERLKGGGTSYILNNIVFDPKFGPFGEALESFNNLRRLRHPSGTFLAGIISESRTGTSVQNDHTHAESWDAGWVAFLRDIEANRHRQGASNADRTNGSANYLFADGRVESIGASAMKQRFDSGENFARPPQ